MSAVSYAPQLGMSWGVDEQADKRFSNILLGVLLPILVFGVLVPLLPLFMAPEEETPELPERVAKLVIERQKPPPPPPPPEPEPQPEPEKPPEKPIPNPEPQPQPTPKQTPKAAKVKAEDTGVLAFADDLQSLRDNQAARSVSANRDLSAGQTQAVNQRRLVTKAGSSGSTGIQSQAGSPGKLGGSTALAGRSTTQVQAPSGGGAVSGGTGSSGTGGSASRSTEEIQIVFDRNKSSLFSLYQRALRSNPALQGTVVLRLTIAPSGEVTSASVVSSELNDSELESKIINRVKLFKFGAKSVPVWTGNYPIKFFPS